MICWLRRGYQAEISYHHKLEKSIKIFSDAFEDKGSIPVEFTCKGAGVSPSIGWSDIPEGTKSLALLVTDDELPTSRFAFFKIVHWILYNIPPEITELEADVTEEALNKSGIRAGKNWSRKTNYYPPCPLYGKHLYVFRVYALDVSAIQPEPKNKRGIFKTIKGHVLAYGELTGFCDR